MWNRLSIKWQLILFMTLVVTLVEISTLFIVLNLQQKNSQANAQTEVTTITNSLKKDFLEVIFSSTTDKLADIKYRLNAFENVNGVILYDDTNGPVYQYKNIATIKEKEKEILKQNSIFTDKSLFVKENLSLDNYNYGYILIDIDLLEYQRRESNITWSIISMFPFGLALGFIISLFLSKNYTRPFTQLLSAIKNSDPTNGRIIKVHTTAHNEIKDIFSGYNLLMTQVASSSKKLHFQAEHDNLTNIKNRFFIEKKLQNALKNEDDLEYNLLYINLDQFKYINDSAGHLAGDELLKMIASEYSKIVPINAVFSRYDGDGFMVLLSNSTYEEGENFLLKSKNLLSDFRFSKENESYSVSASIGLVHFKAYEYTFNELVKAINSALYSAKSMGHNKTFVFNPDNSIAQRFNKELETAAFIKEALVEGPSRFELFAQAIVPLQYETEQVSYEILIRMWDKDNNFIPPDSFLPTAQRYQRMHEIDMWVLWNYLENVTKHPEHLKNLHSAHINLAGSSLTNPDFQAKLKEAVVAFNFPWSKLELEVTETSAVGNFNEANEFIEWLKNVGIGLVLDDFGTGMASFEYLKSMPFDVVKIDGSFVKDMHSDPIDKAVIKYIHEISELKGQETVAEYVETQEDVDELTKIGITYGQGYYLGKPKPLNDWL